MKTRLAILTTVISCALASAAFAAPMNSPLSRAEVATPSRMVCNEEGRCWNRAENPAAQILGDAIRGNEGRSVLPGSRERDGNYGRRWNGERRGDADRRGYGGGRRELRDD